MANLFRTMMHAVSCNLLARLRRVVAESPVAPGPDALGFRWKLAASIANEPKAIVGVVAIRWARSRDDVAYHGDQGVRSRRDNHATCSTVDSIELAARGPSLENEPFIGRSRTEQLTRFWPKVAD